VTEPKEVHFLTERLKKLQVDEKPSSPMKN
jgi:hypothetical protein